MTYLQNDAKFRALATTLLGKFGAPTTFEQRAGGTYDRSTGAIVGGAVVSESVLGTPPLPYDQVFRTADTVQEGSAVIIFAAADMVAVPRAGDAVLQSGTRYRVTAVQTYRSGAQAAAYFLTVEATA